jgi:predicted permease
MWTDLRHSARTLLRTPSFSLIAIAALALGIGVNSAIFSIINTVLLRPAGIHDPDRVVAIRANYNVNRAATTSLPDFADARNARHLFSAVGIQMWRNFNFTPADGFATRIIGARVTSEWFDVFGARPALGRTFRADEDSRGNQFVALLSHTAWQKLFGGEPSAVGKRVRLDGESYEIIGIMPADFRIPLSADIWIPAAVDPTGFLPQFRFAGGHTMFARLQPGVSLQQADTALRTIGMQAVAEGNFRKAAERSGWHLTVLSYSTAQTGQSRMILYALTGAVLFVLLIACANIAGLLLARGSIRVREIAVRAALGAGRWRLMRHALSESLIIAIAGSVAGLVVAYLVLRLLILLAPPGESPERILRIDVWMLLFTGLAGCASGLLAGLIPAWQESRIGSYATLKEGGRTSTGRQRIRSILVVAEVALTIVLLVGAGLFIRSFQNLQDVNPGFETRGLLTAEVSIPYEAGATAEERRARFHRLVVERLRTIPGVSHAAAAVRIPFAGGDVLSPFQIVGHTAADQWIQGGSSRVSPDYFVTLGIPVLRGRTFNDSDTFGREPVAVIDDALSRQHFAGEEPIGQFLRFGGKNHRIIGVVGTIKYTAAAVDRNRAMFYMPMFAEGTTYGTYLLRVAEDSQAMQNAIRQAVRAVDPGQAVYNIQPLEAAVSIALMQPRIAAALLSAFSQIALFLAALGLYGVINYSVAQRTQEIGVRLAVGAQTREVLRLIVLQGLRLAMAGIILGLAGSFALARVLTRELFHVSAVDPAAFGVTCVVLLSTALLASWLPARRAARVDPVIALRHE